MLHHLLASLPLLPLLYRSVLIAHHLTSGATPIPDAQIIAQQAAELATLWTRLSQLKATRPVPPQAITAPPPSLVPPVLFANPEVIDRARDAALAAKDSNKKLSLPEIMPGFKANSLDIRKWLHFPHPPPPFLE